MSNDVEESGSGTGAKAVLRISDLSRLTGIPVSTLRYWCDQNLLTPHVTTTGHRQFEQRHVAEAQNIQRLRKIQGLSITALRSAIVPAGPAPDANETSSTVGDRLRRLRQAAKLTLRELSGRTGIDQKVLASIERTSLGGIPETKALASYYGLTLTELMAEDSTAGQQTVITPKSGGLLQPTLGSGLRIEQMASGKTMMDCQRWYIEPGIGSHGAYDHDGEEFIYVLFGQFQITIQGDKQHNLGQGESIYFPSTLRHAWLNPGQTTTILLWVNTPPTF